MRIHIHKVALLGLQASVGIVLLIEAALLALAPAHISAFARTGLHNWIRIGLAWGEIFFAALFLLPRTMMLGGYGLLAIFVFAAGLHLLHGDGSIGMLIIYTAAVAVVMSSKTAGEVEPRTQGPQK